MFLLMLLQNQNFSFVSHSCRQCSTRVTLVSRSCCSCLTRVASVAIVLHSCRSCLALVLKIRLDRQFLPHPFNCRKVGRVQLSSNFYPLLLLISHSRTRFEHAFLKTDIKSGNIIEKKNKILKDKMLTKSNEIKHSVEFMTRGEKNRPSAMSCPHCIETKMPDKFQIFSD